MRVLVACEFSGVVREAFCRRGHDAWSCDLRDTEIPGQHIKGHIGNVLGRDRNWDLVIAHPPCTYLCNSGVRWLFKGGRGNVVDDERWGRMVEAAYFFCFFRDLNLPRVCIENPIQHKYARRIIKTPYTQIVQPWQFGHGETKATCLWLKNLPPLKPTNVVNGRDGRIWKMPPGPERERERSKTYAGIAEAMAAQWGSLASSRSGMERD